MGNETIKLGREKWFDLCAKIDNEGLDYFIMGYISEDSFREMVDDDKKALLLFRNARKSLREFTNYLRLNDF